MKNNYPQLQINCFSYFITKRFTLCKKPWHFIAAASRFDLAVPMAHKWIHFLTPILNKALEKYIPK